MTASTAGMTFSTVQLPGFWKECVFQLMGLGYGFHYIHYAVEGIMHRILKGRGYVFMAFLTYASPLWIGWVFDNALMGLFFIINIFTLVTIPASKLAVRCV